ncbi:9046_t:CDS:1 [Gigaspora margarita]|uniref:9046_t:CDS:1 n=1 Tax=Gigaspora margarita TaxID=4874 RepID=A0ABN7UBT3_GIGMA|nr:9046_t:CDS:1 [Gigaspora margarita]
MQEYLIVPIGSIDLDTLLPVVIIYANLAMVHILGLKIHMINSDFFSPGRQRVRYGNVIKVQINVLENDIGGTIFYFRITVNTYIELVEYGICTYDYEDSYRGIVITPLSHIKNF